MSGYVKAARKLGAFFTLDPNLAAGSLGQLGECEKCAINCVVRRQNLKTTKNLDRAHESMHENEIYRWLHRRNVKVDRQYIHLINFSRLLARLMGVIVPSRYSYDWQAP